MCFYCLGSLPRASGRHRAGRGSGHTQCTLCACPQVGKTVVPCSLHRRFPAWIYPSGLSEGGAACRPRRNCGSPRPELISILSVGCELSDPNALKSHQLLAPCCLCPSHCSQCPLGLCRSPIIPQPSPLSLNHLALPSFRNLSPTAHTVPFLGPIPAGFGVCCFLGHHRGSWKLGDVGQDCGGRVEHAISPGTDFTGCRLLCPQSQDCSYHLETGQRCMEWHRGC